MIMVIPSPTYEPLAGYTVAVLACVLFGVHAIMSSYRLMRLERELKRWRADILGISSERKALFKHKDYQISNLTATVHTREREISAEIWKRRKISLEKHALEKERDALAKANAELIEENEMLLSENEKLAKQRKRIAAEGRARLGASQEKATINAGKLEKRILALKKAKEEMQALLLERQAAWEEERAHLESKLTVPCMCGNDASQAVELRRKWAECESKDSQIQVLEQVKEEHENKILELTDKLSEYHRRLAGGGDRDSPSDSFIPDVDCPSRFFNQHLYNKRDGTTSGP